MEKIINRYLKKVIADMELVKKEFPELKKVLPIYIKLEPGLPKLKGYISVPDRIKKDKNISQETYNKYKFKIVAEYPEDYPESQIRVKDDDGIIDWNEIPAEHRHIGKINNNYLCTHHPRQICKYEQEDRSIEILTSAWKIFVGIKEYEDTNKWKVSDLPHGKEADKVLSRIY